MTEDTFKAVRRNQLREYVRYFEVDDQGLKKTPGKFEGEPIYVLYFWNLGLAGCADDEETHTHYPTDRPVFGFNLSDLNIEQSVWPELKGQDRIELWESDLGFVFYDLLPRDYSENEKNNRS
jgi:hypothetical protein